MEYSDTISRLADMEPRYQSGFSAADRDFLDKLHRELYGGPVTNTNCGNCYRDAYVLIRVKLKREQAMPNKSDYTLKAGAIIHPLGTSRFYTNPLPSNDVAEEYLSQYPGQISLFAHYPDNWEERVAAYVERKNNPEAVGTGESSEVETLKSQLAEANDSLSELKKQIADDNDRIVELSLEVDKANENLEKAQEEINTLKTENRALKAANTRLKNNTTRTDEPESLVESEPSEK